MRDSKEANTMETAKTPKAKRIARCGDRHPMHSAQVRCDKDKGHVDAEHGNTFCMRIWG